MKELDLMLEGFLLQHEAAISDGAWPELESLLTHEDDKLWDWLQGRAVPDDTALQQLVSAIQQRT